MTRKLFSRRGARLGSAAAMLSLGLVIGGSLRATAVHATAAPIPIPAPIVQPDSRIAAFGASFAPIVEKAAPAVVTIRADKRATDNTAMTPGRDDLFRRFFGQDAPEIPFHHGPAPRERALGSGVIVEKNGYVLTNNHVVENANAITVELTDRHSYLAKIVGTDKASDLAVLKIEATGLPTIPVGDSDAMRVGDVVLAIGDPLGVGETVTMGIVSAKGRATDLGDGSYEDFLQTDAPINQGNSGGALINTRGELIGINSQILSPSGGNIGIGFAIPSRMASSVMQQLIDHGQVRRGRLGLTAQTLSSELASGLGLSDVTGALVSDVESGSPAAGAGLRQGDVIRAVNGRPIADANVLRNQIASLGPGADVTLAVRREGHDLQLKTRTTEMSAPKVTENAAATDDGDSTTALGVNVQPLTPELAQQAGVPAKQGLLVTAVEPGGRAETAGIQRGDVIERANGRAIQSIGDLKQALRATNDRPSVLVVNRNGANLFVAIPREA